MLLSADGVKDAKNKLTLAFVEKKFYPFMNELIDLEKIIIADWLKINPIPKPEASPIDAVIDTEIRALFRTDKKLKSYALHGVATERELAAILRGTPATNALDEDEHKKITLHFIAELFKLEVYMINIKLDILKELYLLSARIFDAILKASAFQGFEENVMRRGLGIPHNIFDIFNRPGGDVLKELNDSIKEAVAEKTKPIFID
jgi:hypothetical protein